MSLPNNKFTRVVSILFGFGGTDNTSVSICEPTCFEFTISLHLARAGSRTYATMRNLHKAKEIKETADAERVPKNTIFLKYMHAVSQLT
jgi:hypothetical protein